MINYRSYYGFMKEPFSQEIKVEELYQTKALKSATERFLYAVNLQSVALITGEIGSGKSTTLRYAVSQLHSSLYKIITVVANTGTTLEILREICASLGIDCRSTSIAVLLKTIKSILIEVSQKKQIPVLIIDEAQLMRLEVFAQLHTLTQFEMDSKPIMSIIFSGQNNLLDKFMYYTSKPLASRVIGRSHLEGLKLKEMEGYLKHHLEIAGIKEQLFSEEAVLAIQQGSGGLLRRANNLARGSLVASAQEECKIVSAEHVRIASTELI